MLDFYFEGAFEYYVMHNLSELHKVFCRIKVITVHLPPKLQNIQIHPKNTFQVASVPFLYPFDPQQCYIRSYNHPWIF